MVQYGGFDLSQSHDKDGIIGSIIEYEETAEAAEYRQSLKQLSADGVDMSKIIRPT
jgi:hypothetical protein